MNDLDSIRRYNAANRDPLFELRTHIGPCLAEGDVKTCSILILLGNPLFHKESCQGDHILHFGGWPLAGLHGDAPPWLNQWWRKRLKYVAETVGNDWNRVSNKVAAININPWASEKFDQNCVLPSRAAQIEKAQRAGERGIVVIAVRARKVWLPQLSECNVLVTRSPRCSYISPNNLGESWRHVEKAMLE